MTTLSNLPLSLAWRSRSLLLLFGLLCLSLAGCQKSDTTPAPAPANIKLVSSATLGALLTDSVGNTLYAFALDIDGANACTSAACTAQWPVYYGGAVRVPDGLKASDFSSKRTTDGRAQTTYKGWPLYYFAPPVNGVNTREAAGLTGGNGVGNVWFVVNPNYGVTVGRKSVTDQTTSTTATKTYLTDDQGRTLYYFAKDDSAPTTQPTNCAGSCAGVWPALYTGVTAMPSLLKASDFGTITRAANTAVGYGTLGSTQQLTYKGHPLYYFASDNATRGRVTGDHLSSFGDYWYVVAP